MIILPTLHRPDNLARFVKAYHSTGASLPIMVIFDKADAWRYNRVETPSHWRRCTVPEGTRIGEIFNVIFRRYPAEDFYGMVADDVVPETAMWDIILRDSCLPDKISWGACGIQDELLPVHPFIGGDLVRKLGWWSAPGLKHWFVDNVWKYIADELNCGVFLPGIKMTHHHFINDKAYNDRTYQEQPSHTIDYENYVKFMKEQFPQAMQRIKSIT